MKYSLGGLGCTFKIIWGRGGGRVQRKNTGYELTHGRGSSCLCLKFSKVKRSPSPKLRQRNGF